MVPRSGSLLTPRGALLGYRAGSPLRSQWPPCAPCICCAPPPLRAAAAAAPTWGSRWIRGGGSGSTTAAGGGGEPAGPAGGGPGKWNFSSTAFPPTSPPSGLSGRGNTPTPPAACWPRPLAVPGSSQSASPSASCPASSKPRPGPASRSGSAGSAHPASIWSWPHPLTWCRRKGRGCRALKGKRGGAKRGWRKQRGVACVGRSRPRPSCTVPAPSAPWPPIPPAWPGSSWPRSRSSSCPWAEPVPGEKGGGVSIWGGVACWLGFYLIRKGSKMAARQ